jgi:peptidoglycan pentaglycine glycine transferase (the first glycine)
MKQTFLQTHAWLEFQKNVVRPAWRFDNDKISANVIQHDLPFGKNYLYVPHGPVLHFDEIDGSVQHEVRHFFDYLKELSAQQNSIFVKLEPTSDIIVEQIYKLGLRKSNKEVQPHRSVVLDVMPSEENILSQMHHKTRYNIKVAQRNGITVRPSDDVNLFWDLLAKTTVRDKFHAHEVDYYRKLLELQTDVKTELYLAYSSETPVAGAILLRFGDTGYYLHGASDYDQRHLMAPYALHWEIIKNLKNQGIRNYDFWGIDAQKWPGVTRFKLGWGGKVIEYPGAFDLPISKFWYFAYNLARKIRNV